MSYMITSDTNLDLTCGAQFLAYNDMTGCYHWTASPAHAWTFATLRDANDTEKCAREGQLARTLADDLPAEPRAEVIPAMEQNADGEWSDGSWDTEDAQGNAL